MGRTDFVQTAKDVVEQAEPRDLRFFVRQVGELQVKHASDLVVTDGVAAIELNDPDAVIHRCEWEDLAIITMRPNALGPNLEFFDVENSWVDPAEGQIVSGIGYPLSSSVRFPKRVGSVLEQAVLLSPMPFNGSVLPNPLGDELKFKFSGFDAERHFLIRTSTRRRECVLKALVEQEFGLKLKNARSSGLPASSLLVSAPPVTEVPSSNRESLGSPEISDRSLQHTEGLAISRRLPARPH